MNFFQKNKSILLFLLVVSISFSFFSIILLIFIPNNSKSTSHPTSTESFSSQQGTSVISTKTVPTSTSQLLGNQAGDTPLKTKISTTAPTLSPTPTELGPQGTNPPPPTLQSSMTEAVLPGTNAPPAPTIQNFATDALPGTNAPPPPTILTPTPETPPPGNGPPPRS